MPYVQIKNGKSLHMLCQSVCLRCAHSACADEAMERAPLPSEGSISISLTREESATAQSAVTEQLAHLSTAPKRMPPQAQPWAGAGAASQAGPVAHGEQQREAGEEAVAGGAASAGRSTGMTKTPSQTISVSYTVSCLAITGSQMHDRLDISCFTC